MNRPPRKLAPSCLAVLLALTAVLLLANVLPAEQDYDRGALLGELQGVTVEELLGKDFGPDCPAETACLLDGRFEVTVRYKNQHDNGAEGDGRPLPFSDQSALFWFFKDTNVELIVKVLDGRSSNGHFWVFYGGLTNVELTMTVTDTVTGATKTFHNPPGEICGGSDTRAFPGD